MLTHTGWPKRLRLMTAVVMMSLALFVQPASAQEPDWTWQNSLPQGDGLAGVWGSSGSDVFAVGWDGTILHYDGSSWSSMSSGTSNGLAEVWGSSGSDVFAVGSWGTIVHYDGSSWSSMSSDTSHRLEGVWGSSGSDVFAVGNYGTILHYSGGGNFLFLPLVVKDFAP